MTYRIMQRAIIGIILFFFQSACILFAQQAGSISGIVEDENGHTMPGVVIREIKSGNYTVSDQKGAFNLPVINGQAVLLEFSFVGYKKDTIALQLNERKTVTVKHQLQSEVTQIQEIIVENWMEKSQALQRINLRSIERLPIPSGNIESLLTVMGASVRNEMSSRYSVRGGSYDENLIYINGIEIYRPMLMKAGQQEGLSCINSSMVASVAFSSGGFGAQYGDKMSSVLDITYKKPVQHAGSVEAGLLGASAYYEGISKNKKFTHLTGIRYKTNQYLLSTLQTKGDYNPHFFDLQTCLTYKISPKAEVSFIGNLALNQYNFIPQSRNTSFGTYQQALNFTVYYEGQEQDVFQNMLGALYIRVNPSERMTTVLTGSVFHSQESVSYDIESAYRIDMLDNTTGSTTSGDSILNLGYGGNLTHARNQLNVLVSNINLTGSYSWNRNKLQWGTLLQFESIDDVIREWEMMDSAGYSIPYNGESLELYRFTNASNTLSSGRVTGYLQNTVNKSIRSGDIYWNIGLRFHYWSVSDQLVVSPRMRMTWEPDWNQNLSFHAAGGLYKQPPFYKELRDPEGVLHTNVKAQESIHWLIGSDYGFTLWERPFRLSGELYFKKYDRLIPYCIDDVDIQYFPQYTARGYATGVEVKINGEFVKDAESWVSLSLLQSKEDRYHDSYGYYRRPTDQLLNFGMYFQDYFPNNPSYRVHVHAYYGSRLPYSSPEYDNPDEIFSLKSYKRIDIGFSKSITTDKEGNRNSRMHQLKDFWFGVEVFNLFDFQNQASYQWVKTISNQEGESNTYAVPNYLTGRLLNIKLTVKF